MLEQTWELLQFDFMRNALLAGVLVSIACGIIGTFVGVWKEYVQNQPRYKVL